MKANKTNYYTLTKANFEECKTPKRKPDYVSNSGSEYWYTLRGVIRRSNHWNYGVKSCSWLLNGECVDTLKTGFCKWKNFELKDLSMQIREYNGFDNPIQKERTFEFKITFKNLKNGVISGAGYEIPYNYTSGSIKCVNKEYDYAMFRKI